MTRIVDHWMYRSQAMAHILLCHCHILIRSKRTSCHKLPAFRFTLHIHTSVQNTELLFSLTFTTAVKAP
jgi:hypothetical protein